MRLLIPVFLIIALECEGVNGSELVVLMVRS